MTVKLLTEHYLEFLSIKRQHKFVFNFTCQNARLLEITCRGSCEPDHEVLVLLSKPPLNLHYDISNGVRGLNFCLSLYLYPNFVYASSDSSGKTAQICRLV